MDIEVFRAENLPQAQRYGEALEAGIVRGNMGSLVVLKLGPGLELAEHAHEQEHVGALVAWSRGDILCFYRSVTNVRGEC